MLDEEDLARLRAAKRPELIANLSRRGGVRSLPLVASTHACVHLGTPGEALSCAIYRHRPNMCREFPAGTEQCMTSREDLYGSPFPAAR